MSRYVSESKWHASQKPSPQKDGSLVGGFELSHTEEIKRWILGFGRHAVVLEPESLRDEMLAEVRPSSRPIRPVDGSSRTAPRSGSSAGRQFDTHFLLVRLDKI